MGLCSALCSSYCGDFFLWTCRLWGLVTTVALLGISAEVIYYDNLLGYYLLFLGILLTCLEFVFAVNYCVMLCYGPETRCRGCWDVVLWLDDWKKGVLYLVLSIACFLQPVKIWLGVIGGIKDDTVKVITVDSMTGEVVNNIQHTLTDSSPTSDSVDGSLPTEILNSDHKQFQSLQSALESISQIPTSDGILHVSQRISGASNAVPSLGDKVITLQTTKPSTLEQSSVTATVPQVFVVDSNKSAIDSNARTILGKRPASVQNSVVNKVIITKNLTTSQPQAVPVQIQTVPAAHVGQQYVNSSAFTHNTPKTPTKTITITQHGILSPGKGTTMTQVIGGASPKLPINKLPISQARTPTKITMIPVSMSGRSPQKILPAGQTLLNNNNNNTSVSGGQTTITMSPTKLIKQPGTVHLIQKPLQPTANTTVVTIPPRPTSSQVRQMTVQQGNIQQIHVPGNKFHYIRLAAPSTSTPGARTQVIQTRPMLSTSLVTTTQPQQMKITIPAQSAAQVVGPRTSTAASVQRIILPAAPNQVSIRPSLTTGVAQGTQLIRTTLAAGSGNLTQIAPGGTFIAQHGNQQGVQGFALVPASYLSQIQQQIQVKPVVTTSQVTSNTTVVVTAQQRQEFVPIASNNPTVSASAQNKTNVNGSSLDGSGGARPRKPCNCTKSQCLKLYCDCFANGEFCHNCNCMNCANNLEHEEERSRAIKSCLDRNPLAFHPKIGKGKAGERDRRHNKGCNCKRSGCLKNYCECYEAKIMCSSSCKCIGCKNYEESPERKTLMHLADAAEVRVLQQTAAKTKLSSQISDLPSRPVSNITGERLPFSFVTGEVVEATCACLLAQAEEADRQRMPPVIQERMVIEEFGRCLLQIIESANRTKAPDPDDTS